MVLNFGLTKSSTVSHSISSTRLNCIAAEPNCDRKKKGRFAVSADYASGSDDDSDYDIESNNNNNSNSHTNNIRTHNSMGISYADIAASTPEQKAAAAAAVVAMLDFEQVEDEIVAEHQHAHADLQLQRSANNANKYKHQHQHHHQHLLTEGDEEEEVEEVQVVEEEVVEEEKQSSGGESDHFLDSLDDVHTRFILNVPQEELSTSERIFFQLEQAWWYYEDLICDKLEQDTGHCNLPRFANLKPFSKRLFEFSPLLRNNLQDFNKLWKEFSIYKRKISTYGCILLNNECTHVVMCQLYKSDVWTFPAGKINQNEIGIDAAARETYEETGFDPHCVYGGLTKEWAMSDDSYVDGDGEVNSKITWKRPLEDPHDMLTFVEQPSGKRRTCCKYYLFIHIV